MLNSYKIIFAQFFFFFHCLIFSLPNCKSGKNQYYYEFFLNSQVLVDFPFVNRLLFFCLLINCSISHHNWWYGKKKKPPPKNNEFSLKIKSFNTNIVFYLNFCKSRFLSTSENCTTFNPTSCIPSPPPSWQLPFQPTHPPHFLVLMDIKVR